MHLSDLSVCSARPTDSIDAPVAPASSSCEIGRVDADAAGVGRAEAVGELEQAALRRARSW